MLVKQDAKKTAYQFYGDFHHDLIYKVWTIQKFSSDKRS